MVDMDGGRDNTEISDSGGEGMFSWSGSVGQVVGGERGVGKREGARSQRRLKIKWTYSAAS